MQPRLILLIFLVLCLLLPGEAVSGAADGDWTNLAPGIDYQEFHLADPNNVFVARMERNNPAITIDTTIAQGRLSGGTETVSGMAKRYDQAINYWGEQWGARNKVIVAVNGYFYDLNTGVPWRGQVQSGWYAKRFDDHENGSGFAWTLDRHAFIGGCVVHKPDKQVITLMGSGKTITFQGINTPREADQLIIYTPQYDDNTLTDDSGLEVLVEMTRPALILPLPDMALGTVRAILDGRGSTPIPFDHVVLSATGIAREALLQNLAVGDNLGISQDLRHFDENCRTANPESWARTYASLGGSFAFLQGGVIQSFSDPGANIRNPRTAVAYNDTYIFFIVVDGRAPGISEGMTMTELGKFAKATLGAKWGINQDGGGSSTMVVNGEVVNNPNANLAPRYAVYLPVARRSETNAPLPGWPRNHPAPTLTRPPTDPRQWYPEQNAPVYYTPPRAAEMTGKLERAVANGLVMVVVEPAKKSSAFQVGQAVKTAAVADVLLGPGSSYGVIATLPVDTPGIITNTMSGLNGIQAKGSYWWKVAFESALGWVTETSLAPAQ